MADIDELEKELEELKTKKKDKEHKRAIKKEIRQLKDEDKTSHKIMDFLRRWAENME